MFSTRTTRLATTNDVAASSAQTLASAKAYSDTTTNSLITAEVATNAAYSVVSNHLDYALRDFNSTSVKLASGEIGNVTLDAQQQTLAVELDFSAAADRSGDCLLYLVNATNVALSVGNEDVTAIGDNLNEINAGTNLVMFTRLKREGEKSLVLVSTKEIK